MFSSLPTLNQIKLSQRQAQRLHISTCESYTISNEQYVKIIMDAPNMSLAYRVELMEACERFNRMRMQDQILKEEAFFSADQRFDIFMDKGMVVIQDEDYTVRYRLFDKTDSIIKITQESL